MLEQQNMANWFERLFASKDIHSATTTLAAALGEASRGDASGVFLLNEPKSHLLLFASWTAAHGDKVEKFQTVHVNTPNDPLCFSLLNGTPYQADLPPSATTSLLHTESSRVVAVPLKSKGGTLGGVIVTSRYGKPNNDPAALRVLSMYAALLIDNMFMKRSETTLISGIRENLARLEEQTRQEQALASTIIGNSASIAHVRNLIAKAAPTRASVLITGETGTGKDLTAEAIHSLSPRKNKPFLKINCGALSPLLLESELFGHVKGAFTGASADHPGLLRSAHGGSVLLDEIGDMPIDLQVKLLRVLQDQRVRPVGDAREYPIDIRIIAATNRDLHEAMKQETFRQDLYHRLAALHIHIPPLRERRRDIPALAVHFFEKLCTRHKRDGLNLPLEAFMHLSSLPLLGNARELANEIERTLLFSETSTGSLAFNASFNENIGHGARKIDLGTLLRGYEEDLIQYTLSRYAGNITKTAEALGIPRSTLRSKIEKSNIRYHAGPDRETRN